jgi:hypothetical protein
MFRLENEVKKIIPQIPNQCEQPMPFSQLMYPQPMNLSPPSGECWVQQQGKAADPRRKSQLKPISSQSQKWKFLETSNLRARTQFFYN